MKIFLMTLKRLVLMLSTACLLFIAPPLLAESTLRILDIDNNTRAIAALDEEIAKGVVEATLAFENSPATKPDGFAVVLENKHSNEKLSRTVIDGTVRFVDVPEGIWTISTTRDGILFTSLRIEAPGPLAVESGAVGSIISGKTAAAIAGSVVVPGVILEESKGDSSREPLSPSQ